MTPSDPSSAALSAASPSSEAPAEPADLADLARRGYDATFLGPRVPLPMPRDPDVPTVVLPYTHFTVVLRPDRRLATATAVCIDGARLLADVPRGDNWRIDRRVPRGSQAGDEIYADNRLDRGHLVRRLDPVWGGRPEAEQANDDTFHFTNAAPQMDLFNQGKQLWQGLENHLLDHAALHDRKLVVLTGPVLHESDPPYRGIQVPLRFWKVAGFLQGGALAATAYILDQSPDLSRAPDRAFAGSRPGEPPPLGAFRTFQVPVEDIADLTGLELGPLPAADLMPRVRDPDLRWRRLESYDDISFGSR
ncbi:DNA/RNA non-specific endonuclease [Streptomyces sp. NPDC000594]|uniref:DNA/RNA non-specific endonuclease n=1 Tax=Streptomyces sp. NPDC000594 TaxID=3154261 RepID=UPI00332B1AAA